MLLIGLYAIIHFLILKKMVNLWKMRIKYFYKMKNLEQIWSITNEEFKKSLTNRLILNQVKVKTYKPLQQI